MSLISKELRTMRTIPAALATIILLLAAAGISRQTVPSEMKPTASEPAADTDAAWQMGTACEKMLALDVLATRDDHSVSLVA
jgi:hypothetical protein